MFGASGPPRTTISGVFLHWSAAGSGMWGEREAVVAPPPAHDSALWPCLYGCPAFLQGHPSVISSLTSPQAISRSHQQPSLWDCSLIPTVQLPATARTEELVSWTGRAVVLCCIQNVTDQLIRSPTASKASSLSQTIAPVWESHPCFIPSPPECSSSPTHSPNFPFLPSSY